MPAMASRGRGRRTINEINMVPFIDVMLVLLIIFMVTAPMLTPGMIDPSVGKRQNVPKVVAQVIVNRTGRCSSRRLMVHAHRHQSAKWAMPPCAGKRPEKDTAVIISADKGVQYEAVVKAMDALQKRRRAARGPFRQARRLIPQRHQAIHARSRRTRPVLSPSPPGRLRAVALAVVVHAALIAALTMG